MKNILKSFLYVIVSMPIAILVIFGLSYLLFFIDRPGNCNSDGKVWDYDRKECRNDCFQWNNQKGCIQLEYNVVEAIDKCDKDVKCYNNIMDEFVPRLCFEYDSAYNLDEGYCDFEFKPEDCHKLEGNWKYPDACGKAR